MSVDLDQRQRGSRVHRRHAELSNPLLGGTDYDGAAQSTGTGSRDITEVVDLTSRRTNLSSTTISPAHATLHDSKDESELLIAHVSTASSSNTSDAHSSLMPVPVTTIFARNAAPLYLPQLDKYLAEYSSPPFAPLSGKATQMFPLLDKLTKSGMTLDDLESNDMLAPVWRYRKNILGVILSATVGILGSSLLSTFYSLQGLFNSLQIFALLLSTLVPIKGNNLKNDWRKVLLGTIPNVLALNFGNTLSQSIFFLVMFMIIAFILLFIFYRYSRQCKPYNAREGLQASTSRNSQWGLVIVTFLLTIIYLPLSTMAVHVLVWSQDLWVVPNPYLNATSFPPSVPPLGPSNVFFDPLDFCWTTTMKRNEINFSPLLIVIALVTIISLTIWFPIELRHAIKLAVPKVDRFTELGRRRNNVELDGEHRRLLLRDHNPFAFLYNGFRRGWSTYESTYLLVKLSALLIIATFDSNNCLFRSASRTTIPILRQVLLLIAMMAFFGVQCIYAPFMDPVNNAQEWMSRLNYVATSLTGLLVVLNIPDEQILDTYVLYAIYGITYSFTAYFIVIDWTITQRLVQRIVKRLDFSLDIFSPRLDISRSSIHVKRRIWQESITALFLTSPSSAIPKGQQMLYAEPRDNEYPPYLLNFQGTPGERHVENLKILRDIGSLVYSQAINLTSESKGNVFRELENEILKHFIGPDCFWKEPGEEDIVGYSRYFGNAWWVPFPPTLVLRYDDGSLAILQDADQLEEYVVQNSSQDIRRKRQIRLALRALEGKTVQWPYQHVTSVGVHQFWPSQFFKRNRYHALASRQFQTCTLEIKRRGHLVWGRLQLGSGFNVQLKYARDVQVSGDVIGLNDDLDLTPPLAKFLELNRHLISTNIRRVEKVLTGYRHYQMKECRWKRKVLSYQFLSAVYDRPRFFTPDSVEHEHDIRVRQLVCEHEEVLNAVYERFIYVTRTEVSAWWYIFWDDLWRRNSAAVKALTLYATDFNPYYPTSIAYTPLPRPALENFLTQRGLLSRDNFFHTGFLNKIYTRLYEIVFRSSQQALIFHVGDESQELDMDGVDLETQGPTSSLGTGDGTDYDIPGIRMRPAYRWEGLLEDPIRPGKRRRRWLAKLGTWFGLTPLWRTGLTSNGLSLCVHLENGQYVVTDNL